MGNSLSKRNNRYKTTVYENFKGVSNYEYALREKTAELKASAGLRQSLDLKKLMQSENVI
jgi:hypothetical protein